MTLAEALARAEGALDAMYATGIANYKKLMRQHGANERQIEEAVAEYKIQLTEDKEKKMAELRVAMMPTMTLRPSRCTETSRLP